MCVCLSIDLWEVVVGTLTLTRYFRASSAPERVSREFLRCAGTAFVFVCVLAPQEGSSGFAKYYYYYSSRLEQKLQELKVYDCCLVIAPTWSGTWPIDFGTSSMIYLSFCSDWVSPSVRVSDPTGVGFTITTQQHCKSWINNIEIGNIHRKDHRPITHTIILAP